MWFLDEFYVTDPGRAEANSQLLVFCQVGYPMEYADISKVGSSMLRSLADSCGVASPADVPVARHPFSKLPGPRLILSSSAHALA
jgi:hypothetical protein